MSERYGTATVVKNYAVPGDPGELIVVHADNVILVSHELLREHPYYQDGILTLDTAGRYRYRRVGARDMHSDIFERVTDG